ncbi:hypothetical protein ACFLV7_14050 [Chloroflexota bacterium]
MTGSTLATLVASLLSLLFSYVPGFKDCYTPKDPYLKRLIMLALVIVAAMGAFSFACAGLGPTIQRQGLLRRVWRLGAGAGRDRRNTSRRCVPPSLHRLHAASQFTRVCVASPR